MFLLFRLGVSPSGKEKHRRCFSFLRSVFLLLEASGGVGVFPFGGGCFSSGGVGVSPSGVPVFLLRRGPQGTLFLLQIKNVAQTAVLSPFRGKTSRTRYVYHGLVILGFSGV